MTQNTKTVPDEGVSKKLKMFVIILTTITLFGFVALFIKFLNKQTNPVKKVSAVQKSVSSQALINEYEKVGLRLINAGLNEQAIDQFITVWEMQATGTLERAKAAQTVGQLYAGLNNCQEALVWLFRAEALDVKGVLPLQAQIDACLSKVRSKISDQ